jgi:hypothetical protein
MLLSKTYTNYPSFKKANFSGEAIYEYWAFVLIGISIIKKKEAK